MAPAPLARDTVLSASPKIKSLLTRLHAENSKQEASFQRIWYQLTFTLYCIRNWQSREAWNRYSDLHCTDQLLSHSKEKCELIYMLACLNGSKSIIECGTSFGVSTIYMALAVSQNASRQNREAYGVLTMEKDSSKVARAKKIWAEAGPDVEEWIHPHEGDLLEILQNEDLLPKTVDLLFLDAWTSLAFPALQLVLPRLRDGSVVFADKTTVGEVMYQDLLGFVRNPVNGFMSVTIPFPEGFEVMVYKPNQSHEG